MRLILNVIWLVLCGFWMFLLYSLIALLLCLTIILIPFGVALFRIGLYALWPFGRTIVRSAGHSGLSTLGNVLWFIPGLLIAFGHLVTSVALAITIIGIPLALGDLKMIPISLTPFGREVVPVDDVNRAMVQYRGEQ